MDTIHIPAWANALQNEVRSPRPELVYSGRGPQFRSQSLVESLRRQGVTGSRGRGGAYADKAAMESFFLLRKNVLDRQGWPTRQDL